MTPKTGAARVLTLAAIVLMTLAVGAPAAAATAAPSVPTAAPADPLAMAPAHDGLQPFTFSTRDAHEGAHEDADAELGGLLVTFQRSLAENETVSATWRVIAKEDDRDRVPRWQQVGASTSVGEGATGILLDVRAQENERAADDTTVEVLLTRLTYSKQGSPADSDNLDNHGAILYGEADDVRYDVNIVNNDTYPGAPTNLTVTITGPHQLRLDWTAPSSSGTLNGDPTPITGYRYLYRVNGKLYSKWLNVPGGGSVRSHTVNGLDLSNSFEFGVQAVNAVGPHDPFTDTYTNLSNVATPAYDYDNDNDGLIEIDTTGRLQAVRYDLNGDGTPENEAAYTAVFPDPANGMGCPASGCVGYELTANLDLGFVLDWQPIGSPEHPYVGIFEGNGRVVSRLRILSSFTDNQGLFGALGADSDGPGVIRNLGMRQVQVFARDSVGGLVGQNNGGAILNSYATGSVSGRNRVGGLAGSSAGRIGGSYATVAVTGAEYVGGLVGRNDANGTIIAGYATGKVGGNGQVGGLAGFNGGRIITAYASGAVRGPSDSNSLAGLVGWNTAAGTVTDSYSNTDNSGRASSLGGPGVADPARGKTTAELQAPTGYGGIFANWNADLDDANGADNPWNFGSSRDYPVLEPDFNGDGTQSWLEFGYQLRETPRLTATPGDGDGNYALTWTDARPFNLNNLYVLFEDGSSIRRTTDLSHAVAVPANQTRTYQLAVVVSGDEQWWSNRVTAAGVKAPTVASLGFTSLPGADGIYAIGDVVQVTVSSEENLTVTGAPTLALDFDGAAKTASYAETAGSAVTFAYTVAEGDGDADGVAIPANALGLNGGTIRDGAGNDLILTHDAVAAASAHRVDGVRPTFASAATAANGATITLTFSEDIMSPPLLTALSDVIGLSAAQLTAAVMDVHVAGTETYVSHAAISGRNITLTLEDAVTRDQTVTVAYDNIFAADAPGLIIDRAGNILNTFPARTVDNVSTAAATGAEDGLVVSLLHAEVQEGGTSDFTVQLGSAPAGAVTVTVEPEVINTKLTVGSSSLTFTPDNWDAGQTVTLTGEQDADGLSYWAVLELTASGGDYAAEAHVRVLVADDD